MKRWRWTAANSLLAVVGAVALVLNLTLGSGDRDGDTRRGPAPEVEAGFPAGPASGMEQIRPSSSDASGTGGAGRYPAGVEALSPETVALALGWRRPRPVAAAAAPEGQTTSPARVARGLRYVGSITESDGVAYRYFKDDRSGRMVRAAEGRCVEGWILSPRGDGTWLLENGSEQLIVRTTQ